MAEKKSFTKTYQDDRYVAWLTGLISAFFGAALTSTALKNAGGLAGVVGAIFFIFIVAGIIRYLVISLRKNEFHENEVRASSSVWSTNKILRVSSFISLVLFLTGLIINSVKTPSFDSNGYAQIDPTDLPWAGAFGMSLLLLGVGCFGWGVAERNKTNLARYLAQVHAEENEITSQRAQETARIEEEKRQEKDASARRAQELALIAEKNRRREEVLARRDSDHQVEPYFYRIGRHGNETLALRYGIANTVLKIEPNPHHIQQMLDLGEKPPNFKRNVQFGESNYIALRKIRPAGMISESGREEDMKNIYLVELTDFRNREALAVIEPKTDYVKTFYPRKAKWFIDNKDLEETLKGNSTMPLYDIAKFHVLKAIR